MTEFTGRTQDTWRAVRGTPSILRSRVTPTGVTGPVLPRVIPELARARGQRMASGPVAGSTLLEGTLMPPGGAPQPPRAGGQAGTSLQLPFTGRLGHLTDLLSGRGGSPFLNNSVESCGRLPLTSQVDSPVDAQGFHGQSLRSRCIQAPWHSAPHSLHRAPCPGASEREQRPSR